MNDVALGSTRVRVLQGLYSLPSHQLLRVVALGSTRVRVLQEATASAIFASVFGCVGLDPSEGTARSGASTDHKSWFIICTRTP